MSKRSTLTIRQSLCLTVTLTVASTLLGVATLYVYQIYRVGEEAEGLRIRTVAETYAAQLAPSLLEERTDDLAALIGTFSWHPDTTLLAVLDERGKSVGVRGHETLLKIYQDYQAVGASSTETHVWNVPQDDKLGTPEMILAATPIMPLGGNVSIGTLVCAARKAGVSGVANRDVWTFSVGIFLVAITGMVLGLFWLKQSVLTPLDSLVHQGKASKGSNGLPTHRQDEIGELARMLEQMHEELEGWQDRAENLERNVTHRVSRETRFISHELAKAKRQIWTDPLTKLGNRRLYDDKFEEIFNAQKNSGQELCVIAMDLDHFKSLNDTLGHVAGDKVLIFLGELLKQCLRDDDLAVRLGGDEFLLILPGVELRDAHTIAERATLLFGQQAKLFRVNPPLGMSAGVASLWKHQPETSEELVQMADSALYQAKDAGKGTVVVANTKQPAALQL